MSGLALVFVAWFGVNIIVRTASLSGTAPSTDGVSTSKIFTSGTFSKEWWEFKSCYPTLPTTCKGLAIGAACGFGACSTDKKNPNCSCYRATATGDTVTCDNDDTTDISVAGNAAKKQCMCTDTCHQLAVTKPGYVCTAEAAALAGSYTINMSATCATAKTVCAKPVTP